MRTIQFDLADGDIQLIKQRVNSWIASYNGADFYLEVVSERQARVKKTKHDSKICCYGCCAYFGIAFIGAFIFIGLVYPAMSGLLMYLLVLVMMIPIFTGWYCLYPNTVEFNVQFIGSSPVKVMVTASGNMLDQAESEYQSFLRAINPSGSRSGIDIA